MRIGTLSIVGVGLIGGSIGLAARRRQVARRVVGVGRLQGALDRARDRGAIDEGFLEPAQALRHTDVVIFCTPVDQIAEQVLAAAPLCASGTLLTDAGSTKAVVVRAVETRLPPGVAFVGSHPLAGSEKRGCEHADADLFQGRLVVVTRTVHTDPTALERTETFWRALGAEVRVMDPEAHDQALAMTSHLPHLVATVLAAALPPELHGLTATGFRDTTRVAGGDPALWTGVFAHNRAAVLDALGRFEAGLARFRAALEVGDAEAVGSLLAQAKQVRDALGS
jgi:prephenate dehydrogenase